MAIATTAEQNSLATKYAADAPYAALFTTAPSGSTPGTEVTGGSPAYARVALSWSAAASGKVTASVTFNVPTGVTVNGAGVYSAASGGTYIDGGAVTPTTYNAQGTYTLSLSFQQS